MSCIYDHVTKVQKSFINVTYTRTYKVNESLPFIECRAKRWCRAASSSQILWHTKSLKKKKKGLSSRRDFGFPVLKAGKGDGRARSGFFLKASSIQQASNDPSLLYQKKKQKNSFCNIPHTTLHRTQSAPRCRGGKHPSSILPSSRGLL